MPWPTPLIQLLATSEDQVDNVYRPLGDVWIEGRTVRHEPVDPPWGPWRAALHRDTDVRLAPRGKLPDNPKGGFEFERDFADLSPERHDVAVVAIAKNGRETVLARRSLIPPAAMTQWKALLDERPALASRAFYFLMMTSGATLGGADEIKEQYVDYQSRTQRIGMSVPLLYMRTTLGKGGDWAFDPGFDLNRKCGGRRITEDNLNGVLGTALQRSLPVNIILNGGIWGDSSCETPDWDLTDHLEQDKLNCQWDQRNEVHPDDRWQQHRQ